MFSAGTSHSSVSIGSASDKMRHPFGFHHDREPRRFTTGAHRALSMTRGRTYTQPPSHPRTPLTPTVLNSTNHDTLSLGARTILDRERGRGRDRDRVSIDDTYSSASQSQSRHRNALHAKFTAWLCDVVQMPQYLALFERSGKADARKIRHLSHKSLLELGISDDTDRHLILEEVHEYKRLQTQFEQMLTEHAVLRPLKSRLRAHAILTVEDLHSIANVRELQRVLRVHDGPYLQQICDAIRDVSLSLSTLRSQQQQETMQTQLECATLQYENTSQSLDSLCTELGNIENALRMMAGSDVVELRAQYNALVRDAQRKLKECGDMLSVMPSSTARAEQSSLRAAIDDVADIHSDTDLVSYADLNYDDEKVDREQLRNTQRTNVTNPFDTFPMSTSPTANTNDTAIIRDGDADGGDEMSLPLSPNTEKG